MYLISTSRHLCVMGAFCVKKRGNSPFLFCPHIVPSSGKHMQTVASVPWKCVCTHPSKAHLWPCWCLHHPINKISKTVRFVTRPRAVVIFLWDSGAQDSDFVSDEERGRKPEKQKVILTALYYRQGS